MSESERRLAAIMFTDVVGFSSLSEKNEALALNLLEDHRGVVRPIISKHHGLEIKTMGDAFLVEFASALEALRCAFEMQQALHEMNSGRTPDKRVVIRVGIHVGDVVASKGDVYGDAVNVASRIEPLAEPGGILITQQVLDQVRNKFEFPISSAGMRQLKNIQSAVEVYKVSLPWQEGGRIPEAAPDRHRLAVLPISNISPDSADEYFADGMTEELISTTSAIPGLTVIARTSVMRYKGLTKGVTEIGRELNVGSVLEGSVRKAGNRLRITVQLIDVGSEGHLWAQSYDRQMEDIFAVQTEIAKEVAKALELKLMEKEKRVIESRGTTNMEAFNLLLKGRYFWNERTKEGLEKGISYFERAIEKDPGYADAYSGLASSYGILANYGYVPGAEALPKAKSYAIKALELDEASAEAHASLGIILWNQWDVRTAGRELRKAIQLNPSYASAHQWYADYLLEVEGNVDGAIAEKLRARELDPMSPLVNVNVAVVYLRAHMYDKALMELKKTVEMFPESWHAHNFLAYAYVMTGRYEDAVPEYQKMIALSGMKLGAAFLGATYAYFGRKEEAMRSIEELQELAKTEYVSPLSFAIIYAGLGDKDEAFRWFDKAYEQRSPDLIGLKNDPFCVETLGADPRWSALWRKIGFD